MDTSYHFEPMSNNIIDDFDIIKMPKYLVSKYILTVEEEKEIYDHNNNINTTN